MNNVVFNNPTLGLALSVAIKGHEFDSSVCDSDANWLMVEIRGTYRDKSFTNTSPVLETNDLLKVADWFDAVSKRTIPEWVTIGFVEPNLEFVLLRAHDEHARIGVRLSHESRPHFDVKELTAGPLKLEEDVVWVFEPTYAELASFAEQFRALSTVFPVRMRKDPTAPTAGHPPRKIGRASQHFLGQLRRRFGSTTKPRLH